MPPHHANTPEHTTNHNLHLHEIVASDLVELAGFIGRISGSDIPISRATDRLSWILLDNPARRSDDSPGWVLRAPSNEIVGCMCCTPQRFCLDERVFTLMMANSFYVDERHRGTGTSIFLKYLQLGRKYPLFVSSANPTVAQMWKKLGAYSLGNSEEEVLAILRWSPLVAESVYRKTNSRFLASAAAMLAPSGAGRPRFKDFSEGDLLPLKTPEEAAEICAEHRSDKLTSCRDLAFLKWRYFSPADSTTKLFAFRPRTSEKPRLVAIRLQCRGYTQQIRALHVLDIWGEPDSHANLYLTVAAALAREYREQADALVFRCLNPEHRQFLESHGFKVRRCVAPIAWCIDKYNLLPTKDWYFVPADGDMFL